MSTTEVREQKLQPMEDDTYGRETRDGWDRYCVDHSSVQAVFEWLATRQPGRSFSVATISELAGLPEDRAEEILEYMEDNGEVVVHRGELKYLHISEDGLGI
jgi:hypothetical protein